MGNTASCQPRCGDGCNSCIREGDSYEAVFSVTEEGSVLEPRLYPQDQMEGAAPADTLDGAGLVKMYPVYPPVARKPFKVDVTPGVATPLGLTISTDDDDPSLLSIDAIWSPGLIDNWNTLHGEDEQVCVGDMIANVNDQAASGREMLSFLCPLTQNTDGTQLHILIQPRDYIIEKKAQAPVRETSDSFTVDLKLAGAQVRLPLGVVISVGDNSHHISIDTIWSTGLVAEWNKVSSADKIICVGDHITGLNGNVVEGPEMLLSSLQAISGDGPLSLCIEPGHNSPREKLHVQEMGL